MANGKLGEQVLRRLNNKPLIQFLILATCLLLAGCTVNSARTWLNYSYDAIERKDWPAAYRLIEDALVSDEPSLRKEAFGLVEKYPQIKQGAIETFSRESLEKSYQAHRERAFSIEKERLEKYQHSIATKEQYEQAFQNYQAVYGSLIAEFERKEQADQKAREQKDKPRKEFDQEVAEALASANPVLQGDTQKLLGSLTIGQISRRHAIGLLGRPDAAFESFTILTWPLRIEADKYIVLPHFTRSREGVTHSLVLAFDQSGMLSEKSLVRIVK